MGGKKGSSKSKKSSEPVKKSSQSTAATAPPELQAAPAISSAAGVNQAATTTTTAQDLILGHQEMLASIKSAFEAEHRGLEAFRDPPDLASSSPDASVALQESYDGFVRALLPVATSKVSALSLHFDRLAGIAARMNPPLILQVEPFEGFSTGETGKVEPWPSPDRLIVGDERTLGFMKGFCEYVDAQVSPIQDLYAACVKGVTQRNDAGQQLQRNAQAHLDEACIGIVKAVGPLVGEQLGLAHALLARLNKMTPQLLAATAKAGNELAGGTSAARRLASAATALRVLMQNAGDPAAGDVSTEDLKALLEEALVAAEGGLSEGEGADAVAADPVAEAFLKGLGAGAATMGAGNPNAFAGGQPRSVLFGENSGPKPFVGESPQLLFSTFTSQPMHGLLNAAGPVPKGLRGKV